MSPWLVGLLGAQVFILGLWVYRHWRLSWALRNEPTLSVAPPDALTDPPLISVIVPARNEEANISACLDSLLAQSYPRREVVVVDDRSEDGTAQVVRRYQCQHSEVHLIQVDRLPAGWTGKTHALAQAAREARGDWLLFVDADMRLHKHNLANAVAYAQEHGVELVTLLARTECQTFWEGVLQPLLGSMLMIRFPLPTVNDPKRRLAFANGQYILIRRSCYQALGGHEAVRSELLEDIALANRTKARGCRLALLHGYRAASVRMYGSFTDMWRGWRRIYIHAFGRSIWRLLLSILLIVVFSLNPTIITVAGAVGVLAGGTGAIWWWLVVLGVVQLITMLSAVYRMYTQLILAEPRYLPFHAVAMVVGVGIFLDALFTVLLRRELVWRGTTYPSVARE